MVIFKWWFFQFLRCSFFSLMSKQESCHNNYNQLNTKLIIFSDHNFMLAFFILVQIVVCSWMEVVFFWEWETKRGRGILRQKCVCVCVLREREREISLFLMWPLFGRKKKCLIDIQLTIKSGVSRKTV